MRQWAGRIAERLTAHRVRLPLALLLYLLALALLPVTGLTESRIDFERAVYYPARAFLDGLDPYEQHAYLARYPIDAPFPPFLPATLLLHLPFGLLPPGLAGALYFLMTLVLVFASARLALAFTESRAGASDVITVAALVLLSRPGRLALRLGQLSFEPVIGTYLALYFARRAPWLGGVGLSLALIKPTFGVPLGLLMLLRRQVRPVAIGGALSIVVNLAVVGVLIPRAGGLTPFRSHLAATLQSARMGIVETANPVMTSLRTDAASLLGRVRGRPLRSRTQVLIALAVLAAGAVVVVAGRDLLGPGADGLIAGFVCVAILLSGYHQAYDLVLLILPTVVLARSPPAGSLLSPAVRHMLAVLLLALGANYLASEGALAKLGLERNSLGWLLLTSVNAVALLLTYVVYAVGLIRLAPARDTPEIIGNR
ncbi:MAG: glycosyltransferase family 87 protein [Gemmatimonadales bacterium]